MGMGMAGLDSIDWTELDWTYLLWCLLGPLGRDLGVRHYEGLVD